MPEFAPAAAVSARTIGPVWRSTARRAGVEGMDLEANLGDLRRHAEDFLRRRGFTYSVIGSAGGEVVGCVYIYPSRSEGYDADVSSWVRADRAELDAALYVAVRDWLAACWPLGSVNYAPR